jgi:hypothetical protein
VRQLRSIQPSAFAVNGRERQKADRESAEVGSFAQDDEKQFQKRVAPLGLGWLLSRLL